MIIEFFGVPGGGKTRLLRQLIVSMPGANEAVALSRSAIASGTARFALYHPISFLVWISELCINANGLFRYKLGLLFRSMAARAHAERAGRHHDVFIDEGLLQRLLTIFDYPLSAEHIGFLLKATPLPDIIVVVRGGQFGRFTVAHNRFNSPRVNQGSEQLSKWMQSVRATAATAESLFPHYTSVVSCTQGESNADPAVICRSIELARDAPC